MRTSGPLLAGVVLAAGSGTRLAPLTSELPKALCPVANKPLFDWALDRVGCFTGSLGVNAGHQWQKVSDHVEATNRDIHLSVETPEALGTAGALGAMRDWINGRAVLVHNADAWSRAAIDDFVNEWDGVKCRLLVEPSRIDTVLGPYEFCGVSLMPWDAVKRLRAEPSGLWEVMWSHMWRQGSLDLVATNEHWIDCGKPGSYLGANMEASGGDNVIGQGAVVEGRIERSVIWPGAKVHRNEELCNAIRTTAGNTVVVGSEGRER